MPETKKHYRVRHYDSVRNDSVIGPALRFAEHVYPEDVGMPVDYACIICHQVLVKTMACVNGHRCCETCYRQWEARCPTCPMCRIQRPFHEAPSVDDEILLQPVRCPFVRQSSGARCHWVGSYGDMAGHVHRMVPY